MNCRIHIERLILDGWPAGSLDPNTLAASLQEELQGLGTPPRSGHPLRAQVRAPGTARRLARKIARSLDSQLGLQKLTRQTVVSAAGEAHSETGVQPKVSE